MSQVVLTPSTTTIEKTVFQNITSISTVTTSATTTTTATTTIISVPNNGVFVDTTGEIAIFGGYLFLIIAIVAILVKFTRVQKQKDKKEELEDIQEALTKIATTE